ncbi:MAG: Ig-like domain-containing protein [Clostridia bacterium]|nr:Ig-like domain-containing protein [Clostridia bacterium]
MASNKQKNVSRVSELPEIGKIWRDMKTIVAHNRQNYVIDVNSIAGRKIIDMTEIQSDESGGKNIIYIDFNDNKTDTIYVFNGTEGDKGMMGGDGETGNQGAEGYINPNGRGITGTMYIVNNCETEDPNLPWSAFRGKDMNDKIYELNETFVSEEEFNLLFNEIKYIYAEFKTAKDNQSARIFNADNNSHITYKKYWTYEDDGAKTYYIYNPNSNTTDEAGNVIKHYDAVSVDLWKDIYLGAGEGYFLITSSMQTDSTPIYYYDRETGEYKLVQKVNVQKEVDGSIVEVYLGDKHIDSYYLPEVDAYISGDYSIANNKWTLELNSTSRYIPDVYKTEDGENYIKLSKAEVLAIDTTIYAQYYQKKGDGYDLIQNIGAYIAPKDVRYYKRNVVEEGSEYVKVNNNRYCEVPVTEIDMDSLTDDFIIVSFDKLTNRYTFDRHYPGVLYGEDVQFNDTVTLSSIDLYYYTDSRVYYTDTLVRQPDGSYAADYIPVPIPNWIYAEFKTFDEDQVSKILNANDDTTGQKENNEVIDTTAESSDTYIETEEIFRIVPGIKDTLYLKTGDDRYEAVNLAKDIIYPTSEYYTWNGKTYVYEEISYAAAMNKSRASIFVKENNVYKLATGTLKESENYWYQKPNYIRVNDPETYLNTYDLVLFYGEPQLLPISIYPATNRSYVTLEYDPSKLIFFEDGRIAATLGNDFETVLTITSGNSDAVAYVNIKVTMPVREIVFDEDNSTIVDVNTSTEFYYSVSPSNASNKNVTFIGDNSLIEITKLEDNARGSRVQISGIGVGNFTLTATADDGYGATESTRFEIIEPATGLSWTDESGNIVDENIKYVPAELYTQGEANAYNIEHREEIANGELEQIHAGDVKVEEYYSMVALLHKEYVIKPVVTPASTTYKDINWVSSDISVAEILSRTVRVIDREAVRREITIEDVNNEVKDATGKPVTEEQIGTIVTLVSELSHNETEYYLTSYAIGNVEITGSLERYPQYSITFRVRIDQSIEEIVITPDVLALNINTRKKLNAEILPASAVNGTISWHSSNEEIVTISPTGTIFANGIGSTTVIARAEDGSEVEGRCNVTVTIPSKDIQFDVETQNGIIYLGLGKSIKINADVIHDESFGSSSANMNEEVNWTSTDTSVATIDDSGNVTAVSLGKTTIIATAKDGTGVFGTIQLRVIQLAESIAFSVDSIEMEVNDSLVLMPIFTPATASNEIVRWASSDETVAKVKESGIIYGCKPGTAEITATTTDGTDLTATCTVTIL